MQKIPNSQQVFDRALVRARRNKDFSYADDRNFLFDWTVENLTERLTVVKRDFPHTIVLGARYSPRLASEIKKAGAVQTLITADIAENILKDHQQTGPVLTLDEERLPLNLNSLDMILSPLTLHQVNDLPGTLIQIRRALKPDGLFLGAILGGQTLHELRTSLMEAEMSVRGGVSPRVAPFADKQQMGALMQRAAFALPVVDSERVRVSYKNLKSLLKDLQGMGESNCLVNRSRSLSTQKLFKTAEMIYQKRFADEDGILQATFEVIFMIGWAPHKSQQKPLRPGSAEASLAEALDTEEIGTGETAKP